MEKSHQATFEDHYTLKSLFLILDKELKANTADIILKTITGVINCQETQEYFAKKMPKDLKEKLVPKAVIYFDRGRRYS